MVQPQPDVMGMVDALPLPRLERESARDDRAGRASQREQRRLFERGRIDVRRERLAVDGHVDAPRSLVRHDLDTRLFLLGGHGGATV